MDGRVAAIVNHYKMDDLTDRVVEALLAQTFEALDVYVVDCCSPEPYHTDKCPVLRMHRPSSLAGSFNWGMRLMRDYSWVWQITNDVIPEPDVLASLMDLVQYRHQFAAVQPSMPSSHPHLAPHQDIEWAYAIYIEWAAPLVLQEAWYRIGPLDAGFGFFSMDIDWCHRARSRGLEFAVDYRVKCDHLGAATHQATEKDVAGHSAMEHQHGVEKYGVENWQELLTKGAGLCE